MLFGWGEGVFKLRNSGGDSISSKKPEKKGENGDGKKSIEWNIKVLENLGPSLLISIVTGLTTGGFFYWASRITDNPSNFNYIYFSAYLLSLLCLVGMGFYFVRKIRYVK